MVEIIICNLDEHDLVLSESRLAAYITDNEKTRFDRYTKWQDRIISVVGRYIVRSVLRRWLNLELYDFEFEYTKAGKPFISGLSKEYKFNISHSWPYVACVFSDQGDVGIDIERLIDGGDYIRIARRYFSKSEYKDICSVPLAERSKKFTQYWTLKEAIGKSCGLGLQLPLNATELFVDDGNRGIFLKRMKSSAGSFRHIDFLQFVFEEDYIASVVGERRFSDIQLFKLASLDVWRVAAIPFSDKLYRRMEMRSCRFVEG